MKEVRVARLRELLKANGNTQVRLAQVIKKAPAQISQWLNGTRTITEETAREIEAAANMPEGWLDTAPSSTDGHARRSDVKATEKLSPPYGTWPFCCVTLDRVMALPPKGLADLDEHLAIVVAKWEAKARSAAKRRGGTP